MLHVLAIITFLKQEKGLKKFTFWCRRLFSENL